MKINGATHYLWRAVDHEGEVLEAYVCRRRDCKSGRECIIGRLMGPRLLMVRQVCFVVQWAIVDLKYPRPWQIKSLNWITALISKWGRRLLLNWPADLPKLRLETLIASSLSTRVQNP